MPGNKRRKRKPGKKKSGKRASTDKAQGGAPNVKGMAPVAKTYGPKPSRSLISPAMSRHSPRNR